MTMTLQEALQTDEVKTFLVDALLESAEEKIEAAVQAKIDEKMPALRESVREEIRKDGEVTDLHLEARRLIEASPLKGAARDNLLSDWGLTEDGDTLRPGRALALVEAEMDGDKVVKSAKTVLRESVDADIKRVRNVLRESAPSTPFAPGGGGGEATPQGQFLGDKSPTAQRMKDLGLKPEQFGATKTPTPTT